MCDNKKKNLNRREFLVGAGSLGASAFLLNPVEMLMKSMSAGFIQQAQASATLGGDPRNYVNVMLAGAPSRYVFDQWIRTNESDPAIIANPMVATKYINSGGRAAGLEYATFNMNGVLVPHMFSHNVMSGDGSQRPLTDLLKNTLVIRGYGSGLDGHPFNAQQQQAPVGGISSLAGCAADYSKKYFEAVQWPDRGAYQSYTSIEGKALNKIAGNTPLNSLMEGFGPASATAARNVRERNQAAFDKASAVLKSYANSSGFGASSLNTNLDNATTLMKKGISGIDGYWSQAVARYQTVIQGSMRMSGLVGISDLALISNEGVQWKVATAGENFIVNKDFDMRNAIATMSAATFMAQGFALAEYILKEGLGTSVEIFAPDIPNVTLAKQGVGGTGVHTVINDMHETGAMASLVICTAFYRGLSAAILELSRQLGPAGWGNTVLQVMGDFSRSARADGSGSDHGFNQMTTSVFSGAITNGPFVVGNIRRSGLNTTTYAGTQGMGAEIDGYNQKGMPTPVMAASTVANLLNIPKNPYENIAAPLVKLENGQLKVLFPAKLKDG
ncbi:hypothetical protein [Bdellovibrio sp. HCB337]|uniref:hypothetical protein n=1 Tax=Bdellovibrio sp. HCB337 TaxID=3394358 RepID=UPI0039A439C8